MRKAVRIKKSGKHELKKINGCVFSTSGKKSINFFPFAFFFSFQYKIDNEVFASFISAAKKLAGDFNEVKTIL